MNLPPALPPRAGREKRGATKGRGTPLRRVGARLTPRCPAGPGTRAPAPAPSCCLASRGAGIARPGAREKRPRPTEDPRCDDCGSSPRHSPPEPFPRDARDLPRWRSVTRNSSSTRLPGRELLQSMRFAGLRPRLGPERKTKSPAAPAGLYGKCKWSALAGRAVDQALLHLLLQNIAGVYFGDFKSGQVY